jgi:hypothetical protein
LPIYSSLLKGDRQNKNPSGEAAWVLSSSEAPPKGSWNNPNNPEVSVAPIGFERSLKLPPKGISEAHPQNIREGEASAFLFLCWHPRCP